MQWLLSSPRLYFGAWCPQSFGAQVVTIRDARGDTLAFRHTMSSVVATIVDDRGGGVGTPLP
jgi:hypothetical protein